MKKILITGSEGVIGKDLKSMLTEHELHCIDKKLGFDLAEADIKAVLERAQPEIVFHLAASFERTKETPEAFDHVWHNDTLASHRLLEGIKFCESVKTVVFASSYLIYEAGVFPPKIDEQFPIKPRNLCGMSKLWTERELEFICSSMRPDIRHVNARIFRVYGYGGKEIISRWIKAKLAGETVCIFNEENRYSFIHARDVATGLMKLAFNPEARGIVNLGTGHSRSIKEVSELIEVKTEKIPDDPEREASCADTTKLKQLTGWEPGITLEEGIKELYEAYSRDCKL